MALASIALAVFANYMQSKQVYKKVLSEETFLKLQEIKTERQRNRLIFLSKNSMTISIVILFSILYIWVF